MSPLRRFLMESKSQWSWLALLILALITAAMFEVSAPVLLGKILIQFSPPLIQLFSGLLPSMEATPYSPTLANT